MVGYNTNRCKGIELQLPYISRHNVWGIMKKLWGILGLLMTLTSCNIGADLTEFPAELHGDWTHESMESLNVRIGLNSINLNEQLFIVDTVFVVPPASYEVDMKNDGSLWWRFTLKEEGLLIEQKRDEQDYNVLGNYHR